MMFYGKNVIFKLFMWVARRFALMYKILHFYLQSFSTRFLSAFWWLFCLVIVFIYVISLKSLIFPAENGATHLVSIQELLEDNDFKFLVYPQGATQYLLQVHFQW